MNRFPEASRLIRTVKAALLACVVATAAIGQSGEEAPFDTIGFELALASAETDVDKLDLIQQAIAKINGAPNPDLALFFELNTLLIDYLAEAGETGVAAQLAAQLAQFAIQRGEDFGIDAVAQIISAQQLAETAGAYDLALGLFEAEFDFVRDAGQSSQLLGGIWDQASAMADRMGRSDEAARLRDRATALKEDASSGATRSFGSDGGFHEVNVFYATDRERTEAQSPSNFYGSGRGAEVEYGTLTVTIPNNHVPGAIEAPSIWRLEFGENPARHVILKEISPAEKDAFFAAMQSDIATRDRKEAFVFIHGFNVKFEAAAKRAAQLAHDMNYGGAPVLYSWPSAGRTTSYVADTAVVRLSGRRLASFLQDVKARSGAEVVHVVAHSMGNRALTDALELLAVGRREAGETEPLLGQVFFAAPDVDAGLFTEMARTIRPLAERLTLYTSQEDLALATSRKLHGNAPRAGQAGDALLQEPYFDTVDMSGLGDDMLAHSYFANDSSALMDIMALIWRNVAPARRCGLKELEPGNSASAWVYVNGECDVNMMMGLIASAWLRPDVPKTEIQQIIREFADDAELAAGLEARFGSIAGWN